MASEFLPQSYPISETDRVMGIACEMTRPDR